ncbi:NAD(P)H-binding protein [soil metagenome]
MKKIALFGGSGKTGQQFLAQALADNYEVKALVRTPAKLGLQHPNLVVVQGDVLNPADVEKTVQGTDLVVSLFGQVKGSPKNLQTEGTRHIVEAMKKHGLRRILSLSGGGLPYPKDQPKLPDHLIRLLMRVAVPDLLKDAKEHAEVLRQSGLDWTIVRGPMLTDREQKGQYRVGWVGVNASTQIGRADLADFILQQVEEDRFVHQMPFVSY